MAKAASLASSITMAKGMASPASGDTPNSSPVAHHRHDVKQDSYIHNEIKKIDPKKIGPSRWANRHESSFASSAFAALKQEILMAGGNVQPIKVRPTEAVGRSNTVAAPYEVVFGHRRHRACLELGLPVLCVIDSVPDRALFEEMERENRNRSDLSAWEQGRMYSQALEGGLYPSMRQLAEALNRDVADVSRALKLASLSPDVVQAFASPLDLQFRYSKLLSDAWDKDPIAMRERAQRLHGSGLPAKEVVKQLTGEGVGQSNTRVDFKAQDGKTAATLTTELNGKLAFKTSQKLEPAKQQRLIAFLEDLFR